MHSPLMNIREAGRHLGYTGKTFGKSSIYKQIGAGKLTKVRLGGRSFVTRDSVEKLILNATETSGQAPSATSDS